MPSTFSNLGFELPANGEQSGTWGGTVNTNMNLIDQALSGQATVSLASTGSSGSPNTLSITDGASSNGRNLHIIVTSSSTLSGPAYLQLTPNDAKKFMHISNTIGGSQNLIVFQGNYLSSRAVIIPNGYTAFVRFDGAGTGAATTCVLGAGYVDTTFRVDNLLFTGSTINSVSGDQLLVPKLAMGPYLALNTTSGSTPSQINWDYSLYLGYLAGDDYIVLTAATPTLTYPKEFRIIIRNMAASSGIVYVPSAWIRVGATTQADNFTLAASAYCIIEVLVPGAGMSGSVLYSIEN